MNKPPISSIQKLYSIISRGATHNICHWTAACPPRTIISTSLPNKADFDNLLFNILEICFFLNISTVKSVFIYLILIEFETFRSRRYPLRRVASLAPHIDRFIVNLSIFNYLLQAKTFFMSRKYKELWKLTSRGKKRAARLIRVKSAVQFLQQNKPKKKSSPYIFKRYYKNLTRAQAALKQIEALIEKDRSRNFPVYIRRKPIAKKNGVIGARFFARLVAVLTKRGSRKRAMRLVFKEFYKIRGALSLKKVRPHYLFAAIAKKSYPFFILRRHCLGRRAFIIPLPLISKKKIPISSRVFVRAVSRRAETSFRKRLFEEFRAIWGRGSLPSTTKLRKEIIRSAVDNRQNIRFLRPRRYKR